ncbi:MAG: pseudouridine synthase [Bacteroidota bacterium]
MPRYFIINKPYDMLSQFTREVPSHRVLADLYAFPRSVYPVGRLDRDSEGLLILTDDNRLNARLLHPSHKHPRTYWVQVEGDPTAEALAKLAVGVDIRIKKKVHHCAPLQVRRLEPAEVRTLAPRKPPVRYRKSIPDTWLALTLTEGKNRQVRRMCAAVGFPVLRLLRVAIGELNLTELAEASVKEVQANWLFPKIGL